jgi:hypothetical protein
MIWEDIPRWFLYEEWYIPAVYTDERPLFRNQQAHLMVFRFLIAKSNEDHAEEWEWWSRLLQWESLGPNKKGHKRTKRLWKYQISSTETLTEEIDSKDQTPLTVRSTKADEQINEQELTKITIILHDTPSR